MPRPDRLGPASLSLDLGGRLVVWLQRYARAEPDSQRQVQVDAAGGHLFVFDEQGGGNPAVTGLHRHQAPGAPSGNLITVWPGAG
jgi:hypothetical protein